MANKWTNWQEDTLKKNYGKITALVISKGIGRTETATFHKAFNLGLSSELDHRTKKKILKSSKKLSPAKAYLLGVLGPGDGSISYQKSGSSIKLELGATDLDFVNEFKRGVYKVYRLQCRDFTVKSKNQRHRDMHHSYLYSKEVVEDILSYAPLEHYKEGSERVPKAIFEAGPIIKSSYLRGVFDSQAWVRDSQKKIEIYKKSSLIIDDIRELLRSLSIYVIRLDYLNGSTLVIGRWKSIKHYSLKIGFTIKRKMEKLNNLLNSYKNTPRERVLELVPSILTLHRGGSTYKQIQERLRVSAGTVARALRGEYAI